MRHLVSRRDALKYGATAPVLLGLGMAATTFGGRTASADGIRLIDFSERPIPPERIRSAGYAGVISYVSEARPGAHFAAKPITRDYADALRAAGLAVVSNYQYGKPDSTTPPDFTRGYDGGVTDARTALRLHAAAGGPDSAPIFFSVDDDIDRHTWNDVAREWFRGINSVLGVDRTGGYGSSAVCAWAIGDGVVGSSSSAGYRWAWQTRSWSHGERESRAVLYQSVVNTGSGGGPVLDGVPVDVDDALATDFGQWDLNR